MSRLLAVVATTHRLSNGFQHTREDLEHLAEEMRERIATDPFLNTNHLETIAPIARQYDARVGLFVKDGEQVTGTHALYIEFEPLPGVEAAEVKQFLENGGFSVAFFSTGIGKSQSSVPDYSLIIGLPAQAFPDPLAGTDLLDEVAAALPDGAIEVRRYHEHALVETAVVAIVFSWIGGKVKEKVLDKLFDLIWEAFEAKALSIWRAGATKIKLAFRSPNGTVHLSLPAGGSKEQYQHTLKAVVDEVVLLEKGTARRRLSIAVTETWTIEQHDEPLE